MIRRVAASWRLVAAGIAAALAVAALWLAHDLRAWQRSLAEGDRRFAATPSAATWVPDATLPGDPAASLLGVRDDVATRRAVQAFVAAHGTGQGFDNGRRRADTRAEAESLLLDVGTSGSPSRASQANDLLGILAASGGRTSDGVSPDDRSLGYFETAARLDPGNASARFNLELVLRRLQATGTRNGPGSGTTRGTGRRGAGSGSPGSGY